MTTIILLMGFSACNDFRFLKGGCTHPYSGTLCVCVGGGGKRDKFSSIGALLSEGVSLFCVDLT